MKSINNLLRWLISNIDPVIAVALAILFGILGLLDLLTVQQSINATLATLGVVAIALIRERASREKLQDRATTTVTSVRETERKVQLVQDSIGRLEKDVRAINVEVQAITPRYVSRDLELAMIDTDRWHYRGGTGTYLRAVTLKQNGVYSSNKKKRRQITIEVVDPTNVTLCERYGRYRRSLDSRGVDREPWTIQRVRLESYATILAACYFEQKYGLLDIELGLSRVMSQFRYDISSHYAIITQEDSRAPSLRANAGSWFYNSFIDELRLSLDQAKKVDIRQAESMELENLEPSAVRAVFASLRVDVDPSFTDEDLISIINKVVAAENPYA